MFVVLAALVAAAAAGTAHAQLFKAAGATFQQALMSDFEAAFEAQVPLPKTVEMTYDSIGSGGGQSRIFASPPTVTLAASDQPIGTQSAGLTSTEQALIGGSTGIWHFPITIGAVTPIVNLPGVTGEVRLSSEHLAMIFEGTITSWDDSRLRLDGSNAINSGLSTVNQPIKVVVRQDSSGTTSVFAGWLQSNQNDKFSGARLGSTKLPQWQVASGNLLQGNGNTGVLDLMLTTQYSIGYAEAGQAFKIAATDAGVQVVAVKNRDGAFTAATTANIQAAATAAASTLPLYSSTNWNTVSFTDQTGPTTYAITTPSYWLFYGNSATRVGVTETAILKAFLTFGISEGAQGRALPNGLIPLPAAITRANQVAIDALSADGSWTDYLESLTCPRGKGDASLTVTGRGASFVASLMDAWDATFEIQSPHKVDLVYESRGSGAGVSAITANPQTVDYGASDAPLQTAEQAAANTGGRTILTFPDALGGVALPFNLPASAFTSGQPTEITLTSDIVKGVFVTGTITNWNDAAIVAANPNLASGINIPIVPVVRSDSSGTTFAFTSYLVAVGVSQSVSKQPTWWASSVVTGAQNVGVIARIGATQGALGYAEYGQASADPNTRDSLAKLQQHGGTDVVAVSPTSIGAAASVTLPAGSGDWSAVSIVNKGGSTWPIATFSYIMVYRDATKMGERGAALKGFLQYINTASAQTRATANGLVALPTARLTANLVTVDSIALTPSQNPGKYFLRAPGAGGTCFQGTPLKGRGASFPSAFILDLEAAFEAQSPADVDMSYDVTGSGGGVRGITATTPDINFGCSDAPLVADELAAARAGGRVIYHLPEVMGGVAAVYNIPGVASGQLKLTSKNVAEIFTGALTKWNDPALVANNPALATIDQDIKVVVRQDSSGTTAVWLQYLSAAEPTIWSYGVSKLPTSGWPTGSIRGNTNTGVISAVDSNQFSIGYAEAGQAFATPGVHVAQVQNRAGTFVLPSIDAIKAAAAASSSVFPAFSGDWSAVSIANAPGAQSWPAATLTYTLVYENQAAAGVAGDALKAFLYYMFSHDAQSRAEANSLIPIPFALVNQNHDALHKMTTAGGSMGWTHFIEALECPVRTGTAVAVAGRGASFQKSIMEDWEALFEMQAPKAVAMTYAPTGSGSGVRAITAATPTVNFAASDAPLQTDEITAANTGGRVILTLPSALGGVAVPFNLPTSGFSDGTAALRLSPTVIRQIFAGTITAWNHADILATNPTLTHTGPITVVVREDSSGTTFAFTDYLSAIGWTDAAGASGANKLPSWFATVVRGNTNTGVIQKVEDTVGAIGYAEAGQALAAGLLELQILNKAGNAVSVSPASIAAAAAAASLPDPPQAAAWSAVTIVNGGSAAAWPIATFSYALVYRSQDAAGEAGAATKAFLQFIYTSKNQERAAANRLVPLPTSVVADALAGVATVTTASGTSANDYIFTGCANVPAVAPVAGDELYVHGKLRIEGLALVEVTDAVKASMKTAIASVIAGVSAADVNIVGAMDPSTSAAATLRSRSRSRSRSLATVGATTIVEFDVKVSGGDSAAAVATSQLNLATFNGDLVAALVAADSTTFTITTVAVSFAEPPNVFANAGGDDAPGNRPAPSPSPAPAPAPTEDGLSTAVLAVIIVAGVLVVGVIVALVARGRSPAHAPLVQTGGGDDAGPDDIGGGHDELHSGRAPSGASA